MKKLIVSIVLAIAVLSLSSFSKIDNPKKFKVTVSIANIKSDKGKVLVSLFDSEGNFLKKGFMDGEVVAKKGETVQVVFEGVPEGNYAVSVIHDKNENGDLDMNFMGIPQEKYGFSNNPNSMFGPPSFEKASFKVSGETELTVKLN